MSEFLPNTDNFFKYLLTVGVLLIVFTILYPVQKQKEVDIEVLSYKRDMELLDIEITSLQKKVQNFDVLRNKIQNELDRLKELKSDNKDSLEALRITKKNDFELSKLKLIEITDSLIVKNVNSNYQKEKIKKLESYYYFFKTYKIILLSVGIILTIIGFRYWIGSVYRDELVKDKDVDIGYKSSFIRHLQFCKPFLINRISILLFLVLIIIILTIIMIAT